MKKILEQLSRTRFFTGFEFPTLFSLLRSRGKRAGFSNPVNNRVLESCSNIFFLLAPKKVERKGRTFPVISHLEFSNFTLMNGYTSFTPFVTVKLKN